MMEIIIGVSLSILASMTLTCVAGFLTADNDKTQSKLKMLIAGQGVVLAIALVVMMWVSIIK